MSNKPPLISPDEIPISSHKTIKLEFYNISYSVKNALHSPWRISKNREKNKKILKDISGVVEPGDIVALMGASGAGKSTLLNVLSRRIIGNEGTVLLNGVSPDICSSLKSSTCYIQQEDLFFAYVTVKEHLLQQASLRLGLPKEKRLDRVNQIIERFSLDKIRNSLIGDIAQGTSRGISGGEKKRLSVATELLTNPKLIFADEPTSGLDAFMAFSVTDVLRSLADMNHTVVTTIHQPSSDVFSLFSKLLLLAEGRLIFYGPRLAALVYFIKLGYPCPPYTNPADHFIELISIDWDAPDEKLAEIDRWTTTWKQCSESFLHEWETELKDRFTGSLAGDMFVSENLSLMPSNFQRLSEEQEPFSLPYDTQGKIRQPSWCTIAGTLLRRAFITNSRNPTVMRARLIQTLITAVFGGLVYFRLSETSNHSKSGACFFMLVNLGFMMTFSAITTFMSDRSIVLRERDAGLYGLATYFWMKTFTDFLFQFYFPILYSSICWYMMGINDEFWRFVVATVFIQLMSLSVSSIGYIVASFSKNLGVAIALGPIFLLPFLMVSGFVIQKPSLPDFWLWLYYISPFVYAFSGLMRAAFLDVKFENVVQPESPSAAQAALIYDSGNKVLDYFFIDITKERWIIDIASLLAWVFLYVSSRYTHISQLMCSGRLLAMVLFIVSNRRHK